MFNYKVTLEAMRRERASLHVEVDRLDQAIAALQMLVGNAAPARTPGLSAKARHRISQAQKKRWAKVKSNSTNASKTAKAKHKISAEGLKNIIDAQNRRWAKVKAAAKAKTKAAGKV